MLHRMRRRRSVHQLSNSLNSVKQLSRYFGANYGHIWKAFDSRTLGLRRITAMFNLAALKYRNVLAEFGGPVARVCSAPFAIFGQNSFQANAYLAPGLVPRKSTFELYGNADGTGSSETPQVARYKAISEALERWAFYAHYDGPNAAKYGFKADRSSNGMAAFPGVVKVQSHRRARLEALERFALVSWWDGRISASEGPSPMPGINLLRLQHTAGFGEVVVVYRKSRSGHVSYAHAAADTTAGAAARALVELARTEFVITCHKLRGGSDDVKHFFERRCLYFASPQGHEEFMSKVHSKPAKSAPKWDPVFDGEIPGPWSKYATVWRCAVKMPTLDFLDPRLNFFFW